MMKTNNRSPFRIGHLAFLIAAATLAVSQAADAPPLWSGGEVPAIVDLPFAESVAIHGITPRTPEQSTGRTWTPSTPSNLPMTTSKPCAGRLSTGQPYLICTIAADVTKSRNPLTIAVGEPRAGSFSRIFQIDHVGSMRYPGAYEHDGKLYIAYTRGFAPQLAVVPVGSLAIDAPGLKPKSLPQPAGPAHWNFDSKEAPGVSLRGEASAVAGVAKQAQSLDGRSFFLVKDSAAYAPNEPGFTLTMWVNPYTPGSGEQQMLAGKNIYSKNQREWGVMIDHDGLFRLYLRQKGWKTIAAKKKPKPGHWHQLGVVVRPGEAQLWLDGEKAGVLTLKQPIPRTDAPLTFGGIDDGGRIRQSFFGAIDEVRYFDHPLPANQLAAGYQPQHATLPIPEPPPRFTLWDETADLPTAADLPDLGNVAFHVIKKWDKPADGYTFLHGVGLAWHKGKLYASFGHNKGAENTVTEEGQYRVSEDGGKTWGPLHTIDAGEEQSLAVSHGVFLSHQGTLWAFHGAYYGKMEKIHTRAYSLDESAGEWKKHGVVAENGFWPLNQPVKMDDGNWIMPGGSFGLYSRDGVFPAAVAISHGDDFTKWDFVRIEPDEQIKRMWGESSLFVVGSKVYSIARYGGGAWALAAVSEDYGRTWSSSKISNLPMATSKPAAGVLSNGQRYLVCTTARNNGGKRTPLTIAVSRPGENIFSKVFVIRRSRHGGPGESADRLNLSYPCAVEHDGKLYVGFSNNGGRRGNLNSAELAVVPIDLLCLP